MDPASRTISTMVDEAKCNICFGSFIQDEEHPPYLEPFNTDCGHTFCSLCIERVKNSANSSCPTCRAPIYNTAVSQHHRLFSALLENLRQHAIESAGIEANRLSQTTAVNEPLRARGFLITQEAIDYAKSVGTELTSLDLTGFTDITDQQLLEVIAACPNIENVILHTNKLTDDGLRSLALLTLRELTINGINRCPRISYNGIKSLETQTQLKKLAIRNCRDIKIAEIISGFSQLTHLAYMGLGDNEWSQLKEKLPHLTSYESGFSDITDEGLATISTFGTITDLRFFRAYAITNIGLQSLLRGLPGLTGLDLLCCHGLEKKEFGDSLATLAQFSQLRRLRLREFSVCEPVDFSPLSQLTNLTDLYLKHCPVSNQAVDALASSMPALRHLNLRSAGGDTSTILKIAILTKLESLTININTISSISLLHLSSLTRLTKLYLVNAKISPTVLTTFAQQFSALESLKFSICHFEKDAIPNLSLFNVRNLTLRQSSIRDEDLSHLTRMSRLERVSFSCSKITSVGFNNFVRAHPLITRLSIPSTKIDDEALRVIGRVLPRLEYLDVGHTKVTDAGVQELLGQCLQLRDLNLSLTEVSDASVPALLAHSGIHRARLFLTKVTHEAEKKFPNNIYIGN